MSIEPSEPYPTKEDIIANYEVPATCGFCGGTLTLLFDGKYTICNNCYKHRLFGERFHFLEAKTLKERNIGTEEEPIIEKYIDTKEVTQETINKAVSDAFEAYSPSNRVSGTYYYLINDIKSELSK